MGKFRTDLTMQIDNEEISSIKSGDYVEVFKISQEVTAADVPVLIINNTSTTIGQSTFRSAKGLIIKNTGKTGAEVFISYDGWLDNGAGASDTAPDKTSDVDTNTTGTYITHLLGAGDFMYLPALRAMSWDSANSAGNARLIDNEAPDSNMYLDSGANVDDVTGSGIIGSATNTTVYLEDGHSKYFNVGDLIRCTNEIMEVTAVGTGADLANSTLTVIRGTHGSTAASDHSDEDAVLIPFFNAYADFDKYTTVQTDASGRYKAMNLIGFGRTALGYGGGITPASFAIKFYQAGYQELGLSGITNATDSGLTAGDYKIDITVDGGALFEDLTFTVGSNTKFGGSDGVIRKIQDALDVQYYTAGNLFEKKVIVSIVNGDIRFTSGQHLSTSAILLADTGDSGSLFDSTANGRIPAADDLEAPVPAKLPSDTLKSKSTNLEVKNDSAFGYDDGFGNILGACTGTINYETGAIDITGCPPNAHFVITATYGSAHSGGVEYTALAGNSITGVLARGMNHKINTTVEIIAVR
jgi:hypothetical protein